MPTAHRAAVLCERHYSILLSKHKHVTRMCETAPITKGLWYSNLKHTKGTLKFYAIHTKTSYFFSFYILKTDKNISWAGSNGAVYSFSGRMFQKNWPMQEKAQCIETVWKLYWRNADFAIKPLTFMARTSAAACHTNITKSGSTVAIQPCPV